MLTHDLPIIGICGYSGAGKTTLIEQLLLALTSRNIKIAIAKHSSKSLDVDQKGKDSDRFYRAGADVFIEATNGYFSRGHLTGSGYFPDQAIKVSKFYDLVIFEGYKFTPIPKIWLLSAGENEPPNDANEIVSVLKRDSNRLENALPLVEQFLENRWENAQLRGCVLIGGKSSRMGHPKHLIKRDGITWLDRTVNILNQKTKNVIVVGDGETTDNSYNRLSDIPGCCGPLSGILAALRWDPWSNIIVCACDMPELSGEAVQWLIEQQKPGDWAVIPQLNINTYEPLFAIYNFRITAALENLRNQKEFSIRKIVEHDKVSLCRPPDHLHYAWRNVNSPEQL